MHFQVESGSGFILAFIKLRLAYSLLLLSVAIVIPIAIFKSHVNNFKLSFIPDALKVTSISYSKDESWGFGPGGNEAGIRIYPLPKEIASQILEQDIEFFNNLPPNFSQQSRKWRGKYQSWNRTPIKEGNDWERGEQGGLNINSYVCKFGFCINIDSEIVKKANDIINSEGSYYAYGRIGMIVVSPDQNLVLYMYNG